MNNKLKWGVADVSYFDEVYGQIFVNAFGRFSYQIINQEQFNTGFTLAKSKDISLDEEKYLSAFINNVVTVIITNEQQRKVMNLLLSIDKKAILESANQMANTYGFIYTEIIVESVKPNNDSEQRMREIDRAIIMEKSSKTEEAVSGQVLPTLENISVNQTKLVQSSVINNPKPKNKKILIIVITILILSIATCSILINQKDKDLKEDDVKENSEINNDKENNINENDVYEPETKVYEVHNGKDDVVAITNLTLTYDGKTLTYPFTLNDLLEMGFTINDNYLNKEISKGTGMGNIVAAIGTPSNRSYLDLAVTNYTGQDTTGRNCVVTYISTESAGVSINGITVDKSTYKNILETFGRDKEERKNTYTNEVIRQKTFMNYENHFNYQSKNTSTGKLNEIILTLNSEDGTILDKVYSITYRIY